MTFIVETVINPNKLANPNSFTEILDIDYNQLITELTGAYSNEFAVDSYTLNNRTQLKRNVNTHILNLFDAYKTLAADSERLTYNLTNIRTQLDTLKINNVSLKDELSHMYELSEGSSELINDYKQLYNINYTKNWGIFMSIIFSCYVMYTMFKSKPITL
jgi:hypothetical protein